MHSTPKEHNHEIFMFVGVVNPNPSASGRVAYERTCAKCHGADGRGDKGADRFFNVTIPRLSSTEVQSKSDAELREIITKGGKEMAPVEIDESGYRHRLPPQSVDAVIAYVRTLKR